MQINSKKTKETIFCLKVSKVFFVFRQTNKKGTKKKEQRTIKNLEKGFGMK